MLSVKIDGKTGHSKKTWSGLPVLPGSGGKIFKEVISNLRYEE